MRRFFLLTLAGLLVLGAFVVGSALFEPAQLNAPAPAEASLSVPAGRGEASGRLASASFVATAADITAPDENVLAALYATSLSAGELRGDRFTTTVAESTTTTIEPGTTTTVPATTTSTAPPTTTTSSPPSTTTTSSSTTTTSSSTTTTSTTIPPSTTTTTTTSTTVPSSGPLTETEMRDLAARFFPAEEVDKAVLVAWCESNYDPSAYNPAGPYGGLYQHLETYWDSRAAGAGYPGASIFDAEANTAAAHLLWSSNGWGPWPYCSAWADGQL